jgi:NAD(P)-dependent dehydrogenase (short-subunit alcohol dehydrogenase family)
VEDLGLDEIQTLLDINIRAPLLCSQEAVRIMKAQVPQGGR